MIKARSIQKSYTIGRGKLSVLRGASLTIERGEFLVIRGTSGSGKSTLLHILGALDSPDMGGVEFEGDDVFTMGAGARNHYRNKSVGFVFQFYHLLPELSALENAMIPRFITHSIWQWPLARGPARKDAHELLERVGLGERIKHRPAQLSGGELQRVAIARALINRPALLLADEPTGNLDAATGKGILDLLIEFNREGQTVVMVTHDPQVARRAHRCVELVEGKIRKLKSPNPSTPAPARA